MRRAFPLLVVLLAGCVAPDGVVPAAVDDVPPSAVRLVGGGAEVDVPIDVILVGFAPGTAEALSAALEPETVVQFASDDWRDVPPNASRPPHAPTFKDAYIPLPLTPTARWNVRAAPAMLAADLLDHVAATRLNETVYDANAAEAWLAARLPAEGFAVRAQQPPLILLHLGEAPHAWRYTFPNGWLEPVRVFGEREPLLVLDVSAEPDPYQARDPIGDPVIAAALGGSVEPAKPYEVPLAPRGAATVDALAQAAIDAVRYRLLHGSAAPPTLRPCHAITLVVAERATGAARLLPGTTPAEALVAVDELRAGWEMMTGKGTVRVDLQLLRLPQDDPVLDAITRPLAGAIGGTRGYNDAMRWWLIQNWETYWVPHDGCEAYVSLLVLGDATDDPVSVGGYSGIAMHDAWDGTRISLSMVSDRHRLLADAANPLAGVVAFDDPTVAEWRAVMYLFSHETGHLIAPHHPHNNQRPERVELRSWSSVWTPMSYQVAERSVEFGAVERANWLRNRAGFALAAAREGGHEDAPAFAEGVAALAEQDWERAGELFLSLPSSRT